MSLSGRTALVTGASGDIGREICLELLDHGMNVMATDLCRGTYTEEFVEQDLSDPDAPERLVQSVSDRFGGLDLLVNCAGICPTHPLDAATSESWQKVLYLNTVVPALLATRAADQLGARGGSIVNVASVSAFLPKVDQVEYGASKAALVSVTRSLAKSLAPRGIRVNAVAPGVIDTELTRSIAMARSAKTDVPTDGIPLGRMGLPREVACVVRFLASPDASYVTGQTLNVCGGLSMR